MSKEAFIFPGQGTQRKQMAQALLFHPNPDISMIVNRTFEEASNVLGNVDLKAICLSDPNDLLDIPGFTEPAVLTTSVAALRVLSYYDMRPDIVAGHSLGEFSALVASEVLTFPQAVRLVNLRGQFMERAATVNPGGMAAVLGLSLEEIEPICEESEAEIANINAPNHIVISGKNESITKFTERIGKRAIVKILRVSIPSHSSLMESVREDMRELIQNEVISPPVIDFIQNTTADYAVNEEQIRQGIVDQPARRVLWWPTMELMVKDGVINFIDIGPGEVLARILQRESSKDGRLSRFRVTVETIKERFSNLPASGTIFLRGQT